MARTRRIGRTTARSGNLAGRRLGTVLVALACTSARTDSLARERWPDWTIGLGGSYASEPYLDGQGREQNPYATLEPFLEIGVGPLTLSPLGASLTVFEWGGDPVPGVGGLAVDSPWELSGDLFVDFGSGSRDQDDDTIFAGMEARGADTDIGLWLDWFTPVGLFSASVGTEVGSGSAGQALTLGWGVPLWTGERTEVFADAGLEWLSADAVRHDYGVRASEARAGRPPWKPGSALVPRVGLGVEFELPARWSLFGLLDVSRWPDEIRNSPLTDDDASAFAVAFGLLYTRD